MLRKGDRVRVTGYVWNGEELPPFVAVAQEVTTDEYGTYVQVPVAVVSWDESQRWYGWASTVLGQVESA